MIRRTLDAIDKAAIDEIVANKVIESKTLEYKETLPGNSDADRKEFLADVSSFANASGGDIVYGVKAEVDDSGKKTGLPEALAPITNTSADEAKLKLEEVIRNGVAPRMRVQMKTLAGQDDGFVLVIRVPRSFSSPHVVTHGGSFRFYSRNSAGKYPLDVTELRSAFLATESQSDRIKRFREDRLARIVADETPVTLVTRDRLVLHIVPLLAVAGNARFVMPTAQAEANEFRPIGASGWNHRVNLDGALTWQPGARDRSTAFSYCQLFADGALEAVVADLLGHPSSQGTGENVSFLPSRGYEEDLIRGVRQYMGGLRGLGVVPPLVLFVSILGCRGAYLGVSSRLLALGDGYPIDHDALLLPDVTAEDFDVDVVRLLRPVFDAVWNACGYARSMNYDEEGNWMPRG